MRNMSRQLAIAALASVLSLTALALSADGLGARGHSAESVIPALGHMPDTQLPALPAIFPR